MASLLRSDHTFHQDDVAIKPPLSRRNHGIGATGALIEGKAIQVTEMNRFAFYERALGAYAMVATGERRLYANIILVKGVIRPEG